MKVAFAGGVTGGHIAPAVALAERIAAGCPASRSLFLSIGNEVEQRMIARRGLELVKIAERSAGLGSMALHVPPAVFRARRRLAAFRPDAVVGLGGNASLGPAVAAITLRVPLILLEQNITPGKANRRLAPFAAYICCQWAAAVPKFRGRPLFTGSPVRAEILAARAADKSAARTALGLHPALPTLLVMGGSQGAQAINLALRGAAARLAGRVQILHLAGAQDEAALADAYWAAGVAAHVTSFLEAMHLGYAAADIALCRAGATSIAELAAAGLPAILVPYPFATDNHQLANANEAAGQGWAVLLEQDRMTADRVVELLDSFLSDAPRREAMQRKALAAAPPDPAAAIIEIIRSAARMTATPQRAAAGAGIL